MKTLKDLEIAGHEVVRAEAIKWVNSEYKSTYSYWKQLFMRFFNITEEDLK